MNKKTATILKQCGVPPHILGYKYLGYAIENVIEKPQLLNRVTTELYPEIAEHFGVEKNNVERAIRTAVTISFGNLTTEQKKEIFGNTANHQTPSNALFIGAVAELLEYESD